MQAEEEQVAPEEERSSSGSSSYSWSLPPLCVREMHTPRRRNAPRRTQPDWSDNALDVLLNFTQFFGTVSLFEAALSMGVIARQVSRAYVGVAFLWSFFAISLLHTISAALEVFETEFAKNWAVLGLDWTVNFSGLLLFVITKVTAGDYSLPWLSMIAPVIQTIVLAYALRKVPGKAGGVRAVLVVINIGVLLGLVAYIKETTSGVTTLCADISLIRFDSFDRYYFVIPDDCFDAERLRSEAVYLVNENPIGIASGDDMDVVFVVMVGVSVVVVGGSFVSLIVSSRWPLEESSNAQLGLKALVVCGWVALYPVFELLRVLGKLLRWLTCLSSNLKGGKYTFELDGRIVVSQEEVEAPVS